MRTSTPRRADVSTPAACQRASASASSGCTWSALRVSFTGAGAAAAAVNWSSPSSRGNRKLSRTYSPTSTPASRPDDAVELEVDAAVDPALPRFRRRLLEAVERPGDARQALRARGELVVGPEQVRQDRGRRRTHRAVRRGVGGEVRGPEQRRPGRVGRRVGVAVGVGGADRGHRPPEVVLVLGVPGGDEGVGHGDVQQGEQAGVADQVELLFRGHLLGDDVPVAEGVGGAGRRPPRRGRSRVCSAVRVVLVLRPRSLTSLKAAAYSALSSAGGAGGRNCAPLVIANGVTSGHCGPSAGKKAGGVGCQSPGSVPGV